MSYDIIRGINFKDNKVNICSACNNVYPRSFHWGEAKPLTKILHEQGKEAVIKIILYHYWCGNFQKGRNTFDNTIRYYKSRLPHTWDNVGTKEQVGTVKYPNTKYESKILYSHEELEQALYEAYLKFKNRDMTKKWVIKYKGGSYLRKRTVSRVWYTDNITGAKVFKSREDAWLYYPALDDEIVEYK